MAEPAALAALRPLPCPACGQRQDLAVWLDQPDRAWQGERRVRATCCACGAATVFELQTGSVSHGSIRIAQPGLSVQASPEGLLVHLSPRRWFLPRA